MNIQNRLRAHMHVVGAPPELVNKYMEECEFQAYHAALETMLHLLWHDGKWDYRAKCERRAVIAE